MPRTQFPEFSRRGCPERHRQRTGKKIDQQKETGIGLGIKTVPNEKENENGGNRTGKSVEEYKREEQCPPSVFQKWQPTLPLTMICRNIKWSGLHPAHKQPERTAKQG